MTALWLGAESVTENYLGNTWGYTDQHVAAHQVNRTWIWGPPEESPTVLEPYSESRNGLREVQYFDTTRMGITLREGDTSTIWCVNIGFMWVPRAGIEPATP